MDTYEAMMNAKIATAKDSKFRVFDWNKAAEIIKSLKNKNKVEIIAGLRSDLEWTSGVVYKNGETVKEEYMWLESNWAIPVLVINDEEIECWKFKDEISNWNNSERWPENALKILNE